ncbi:MAG TPA: glycosyltransferase family 4 protein [Candidatus Omnitrophota bacterium]|nr:glycosyltransferase family 4 protein [Candidatus Omnitrophota bacterium]
MNNIALEKKTILFLFPGPVYRPDLPDFQECFDGLSTWYDGLILTRTWEAQFEDISFLTFKFKALSKVPAGFFGRIKMMIFFMKEALGFNKLKKINVIVCYEPMFTGVIGALLKLFLHSPLIVEVNSEHYAGAIHAFYGRGIFQNLKALILMCLSNFSLFAADGIKVLTEKAKENLPDRFKNKEIFVFHGFVPTQYFNEGDKTEERYILFVGYPFYLKGVDILINAFKKISDKFPDVRLRLIGHQIEEDARKNFLKLEKIDFYPGLYYDQLKTHFLHCYCFVLPSRTEGMGRVLIEAMAAGKAVIGSKVGGIPDVIEDKRNGFLFEAGDENDLAQKLEELFLDPELARRMGREGLAILQSRFSSNKYFEYFCGMIEEVIKKQGLENGI